MLTRRLVLVTRAVILIAIMCLNNDGGVTADIGAVREGSPPLACTNFPSAIWAPEGKYLLVEFWTHSVLGVNCPRLCIDFPTYYFDPQSGELSIYLPPETAPVLGNNDKAFMGSGESLGGVGCGAVSHLTAIQQYPWSEGDITLCYVDGTGAAVLERQNEAMILGAGETWVSDEEVEIWDWLGPDCVVTSTHRISNYAFQDRDEIVYVWSW